MLGCNSAIRNTSVLCTFIFNIMRIKYNIKIIVHDVKNNTKFCSKIRLQEMRHRVLIAARLQSRKTM